MEPNHSQIFDDFVLGYTAESVDLARKTRRLIQRIMPNTVEQFDPSTHLIAYGIDRTYKGLVCGIILYKDYVNLMFAQGTLLPDPAGLLTGTGKRARHVRITNLSDLENPDLQQLLQAAIALKKPGL
jgi:hypothetical protein